MNLKNYFLVFIIFSLLAVYPLVAITGTAKTPSQNEVRSEIRQQNEESVGHNVSIKSEERIRTEERQTVREREGRENFTEGVVEVVREKEQQRDNRGISEQVHAIIESRKNGTIDVPQGVIVRVIASNRSVMLEDVPLALNESLHVRVRVSNRERGLEVTATHDGVIINDSGVKLHVRENLRVENGKIYVSNISLQVFPSQLREKIRLREMKSVELHVANGVPIYSINATRRAKLLWLFDTDMDVKLSVDAVNGTILNEQRPWWGFLASIDTSE